MINLETIVFAILALIAVAAAVLTITSRNAVHSALFLVVVMSSLAVFFLGLWAPFVAMVQVAVYAGAIMVLFLFVIMLLGAEKIGARMGRSWQTACGDWDGGGRTGTGRVHVVEHCAHRSARSAG